MELKANELRIGNWVTLIKENIYENKDYQLDAYDIYKASEFDDITECLLPIPLTEEWLIKFGVYDKKLCIDNGAFLWIDDDFTFAVGEPYEAGGNDKKIKYVHQLQNLYHSLTVGLELQIIK